MNRLAALLMLTSMIVVSLITAVSLWFMRPYLPYLAMFLVVVFVVVVLLLVSWLALHVAHHAVKVVHATDEAVYVSTLGRVRVHQHTPFQTASTGTAVSQVPTLALPEPNRLPTAPAFSAIAHQIGDGRLILGYSNQGAIYGSVDDLLSMGVVGKPGTGKSSALLFYLTMLILSGAMVYVLDPHGSLNELSAYMNYTDDLEDIGVVVPELHKELDERSALYKQTKRVRKPLLVLIDELPVISRWEQKNKPEHSTLELVERVVLEARKFNCYVILSGQSLPAEVLPTLTRDNLSSRIVFNSSGAHARMIGLDELSRKKLLPLLKSAPSGTAILDVSRRSEAIIVSLPHTSIDDLREAVGMNEYAFTELHTGFQGHSPLSQETPSESFHAVVSGNLVNQVKADEKLDESIPEYSREEAEEILQIARTQLATYGRVIRSRIPAAMNPPRNNAIYPVVKLILDREGL